MNDKTPSAGHNSGGLAGEQLLAIINRLERLEEEKKAIAEYIKEVFAEAKGNGFDVKILRKLIAIRKRNANDIAEEEAVLDVYKRAIGMMPDGGDE